MSLRANEILEKIEKMEHFFLVNGNLETTEKCKREMQQQNWVDQCKKNEPNLPLLSERETTTELEESQEIRQVDVNAFQPYLNSLKEYKDVTKKLPVDTRFKSVKNVINRMMLVTTRYQEIFNNHLVDAFSFMIRKIHTNERDLIQNEIQIKQLLQDLNKKEKNTDQKIENVDQRVENIDQQIQNVIQQMQDMNQKTKTQLNQHFIETERRMKEIESRITGNSNWIDLTNKKLDDTSKWVEGTNTRIDDALKWVESTNKRVDDTSKWVEGTNTRIDDTLKWVESTNNRITEGKMFHDIDSLRKELFAEIRYELSGSQHGSTVSEIDRKNQEPLFLPPYEEYCKKYGNIKKLNLGCGLVQKEDYLNIDGRALEGVAIAADVQNLPFKENEIDEIYAAHLLEHFELKKLYSEVVPYWVSLLKKGGIIRLVVPNIGLMTKKYVQGEIPFTQYREVVFGGQEYVGNYHYTMFDEEELHKLLKSCGLKEIETVVFDRVNGLSFEIEVIGKKG